jgi:hypothetical protein
MGWRKPNNYDDYTAPGPRRRYHWLHLVMDGSGLVAGLGIAVWWLLR